MPRQYTREPLSLEEGNRLIQACDTLRARQVIGSLLETGLRVSELAQFTKHDRGVFAYPPISYIPHVCS
jgi:integrase